MKNNYGVAIWVLLIISTFFTACKDNEEKGEKGEEPEGLDVNHWIEKTMRDNYLWNTELPAANKLNYMAEPQDFFRSLLSMKDGKTRKGTHHFYSFIEKNKDYTGTRSSIDRDDTYGMEFTVFAITDRNGKPLGYYWARVLYVLPNSPASASGLSRGDWIVGFDGLFDNIKGTDYNRLLRGGAQQLTVTADPQNTENFRQVSLEASQAVEDNPSYSSTIIQAGGKKIGYLLYNHFTTGPKDHTDRTYDRELEVMFQHFASQNVDEFVLDLRYNGGGFLISANVLAALLVPEQHKDAIFSIDTDNKGRQSKRLFSSEKTTTHLKLNRLFVLTSSSTASASEAVINGLSPFLDVILIGKTTEGKNVGSVHYAKDEYEWALQPIILRITSSDTSYDYSDGLPADILCDEFNLEQNTTDQLLPLGNKDEFMLKTAIEQITGIRSIASRTLKQPLPHHRNLIYNSVDRHQTNGVLLTPNYTQDAYWNH